MTDVSAESARLVVEDCWASDATDRQLVRHLLVRGGEFAVQKDDDGTWFATDGRQRWRVYWRGEHCEGWNLTLRASLRLDRFLQGEAASASWLGGRDLPEPAAIASTFDHGFEFLAEDPSAGTRGLRRPQLGALHSVLGYWTTGRSEPATVVMPTGTGKTETMVALLAAASIGRLLVVVPSDALRTQVAGKFETLGLLQELGVLARSVECPVVGQMMHGLQTLEAATAFARRCNVVVTTPHALRASRPEARAVLFGMCSHLFIDEAHHVPAATWTSVRDAMHPKPVVQFTATPYREDGRILGGRQLYAFPLKEAQADHYFARINYVSVVDFTDTDRAVASRAVDQLRSDRAAGLDHVLMARTRSQKRAEDLLPLYEELAADLGPVVLHSGLPRRDRETAQALLRSRESRIIICVDMLGEGFDLPALKVAAIHDPHRSLAVTLQFIGRFARVAGAELGDATAIAPRPERSYDPHIRRLYAEDADWNAVIRDLSDESVEAQQEISDFEASFGSQPDEVTLRNLEPKMSTVIYRTRCERWKPDGVLRIFPEESLLTTPIAINEQHHVAWFVTHEVTPVRWGNLRTVEETHHHLYVIYWDQSRQLLYINSSNTDSVYPELARAVGGDDAERIVGEDVYRVMAHLARLVPTNIGVLDTRNRSRRFSMHVGADVIEGFPEAEAQTKTKTNIFATGYESGERVTIGAALKGRIWSQRAASSLPEWMAWCNYVGAKVVDEGISVDDVMRGFIRPAVVKERPPLVPLAVEWPWQVYFASEDVRLSLGGKLWPLIDSELKITRFDDTGPIAFEVRTPHWTAPYVIDVTVSGLVYRAVGEEVTMSSRQQSTSLTSFFSRSGPSVLFANDVMMVPPGLLLSPPRDIPPFDPSRLATLEWEADGINIRKESQGSDRDPTSIQARAIRRLIDLSDWALVMDDDGAGEVADVVAIRIDGEHLVIHLTHCKFSSEDRPGARVEDLYELCGQAQKSVRWRRDVAVLFENLIRRERNRQKAGRTGLLVGTPEKLYELADRSRLLRARLEMSIVQPGVSASRVTPSILELLASTEVYVRETVNAPLEVLVSP
jgi:superfamily II DNA or RNA helicase